MCKDWLRQKALRSFWHKASKPKPRRLDFVQQVDAPGFWQSLEFIHRQHRKLQVPLRLHKTCMIHDCTCVEQVCTSLRNVHLRTKHVHACTRIGFSKRRLYVRCLAPSALMLSLRVLTPNALALFIRSSLRKAAKSGAGVPPGNGYSRSRTVRLRKDSGGRAS